MKFELTLPALERLIGGDTEIEITARRQIVEHFAKTQLKSLLRDEAHKTMSREWVEEIRAQVAEVMSEMKAARDARVKAEINPANYLWDVRDTIRKAVESEIKDQVEKIIESRKHHYVSEISRQIRATISEEVRALVAIELTEEMLADLLRRVRARLDMISEKPAALNSAPICPEAGT